MKRIIILAFLGILSLTQVAFADVIPTILTGKWFFNGNVTGSNPYFTVPQVVGFAQDGSFTDNGSFGSQSGEKFISCLVTFAGTITSVKQTGSASYVLEGMGKPVDGSIIPLPGNTLKACQDSIGTYSRNLRYSISNFQTYSFEIGDQLFKKVSA